MLQLENSDSVRLSTVCSTTASESRAKDSLKGAKCKIILPLNRGTFNDSVMVGARRCKSRDTTGEGCELFCHSCLINNPWPWPWPWRGKGVGFSVTRVQINHPWPGVTVTVILPLNHGTSNCTPTKPWRMARCLTCNTFEAQFPCHKISKPLCHARSRSRAIY